MQKINSKIKFRRDYSHIQFVENIPNLIEMQKRSYENFLQRDINRKQIKNVGIEKVLKDAFPIHSADGRFILEYISYSFDPMKHSLDDAKYKSSNYSLPLRVKLRLITNDVNKETGLVQIKDVKEQDVYFADIPLMTDNGTFVINGTERVVVSQIYRSPGVFIGHDKGKNTNGKLIYSANVIPHIGSWLDIEFDNKDLLFIRIDKRKKIPLTALLRSLDSAKTENTRVKALKEGKILSQDSVSGMSNEEILETFYDKVEVSKVDKLYKTSFIADFYKGKKLDFDLIDAGTNKIIIEKDTIVSLGVLKKLEKSNIKNVLIPESEVIGKALAKDIYEDKNLLINCGTEITKEHLALFTKKGISVFEILLIDNINVGPYILNSLNSDPIYDRFRALNEIYKSFKLTDAPNFEVAEDLFYSLFFTGERYDLSEVGRVKINERFGLNISEEVRHLTKADIISTIKSLIKVRDGLEGVDDIDNLSNRRIRSVGELIENELRVSFLRLERAAYDRMATIEEGMPNEIINVKIIQATLKEFFGTSQLSQFMDQTNPLSEITHKRRLSALGPNGLTRERANFEVRDVHVTHYGRICPIETPEGPNIGLINSLAVYAKINKYGFLETPYRKVEKGVLLDKIEYMNAAEESKHLIAQSTSNLDGKNKFTDSLISARKQGEVVMTSPSEVDYMDVSPRQLVSVAASLIPFLENDDANRALMGANMQRQAVPLLKSEAPIVGTGMERVVARDSGVVVLAKNSGVVYWVDGSRILVKNDNPTSAMSYIDVYNLQKFQKSNHNTCINQKAIVKVGERVSVGDVIADGHCIDNGELALGKNVLVAFMPWNGYNFEDSILISERVVKDDMFTSIHIEEFEVVARDTKLGAEEITIDIPNIGEEAIKNLDESGIVYIGAEVKSGDILVGKVTPKAETVISAEEKLLKAIFGEKSADVKDTSLRVPSGINGTVIGVKMFSRRGVEKDARSQILERNVIDTFMVEKNEEQHIIEISYALKARELLIAQTVVSSKNLAKDKKIAESDLENQTVYNLLKTTVKDKNVNTELLNLTKLFEESLLSLKEKYDTKIANLQKGDDLATGVLKVVKIFLAVKRKLQSGDKMAGRHGNKGVVSKIVPIEDMPHLEDGTPVDICLSPLGVPSRMNVGQVLEVHLGWAAANIGKKITKMLDNSKPNIKEIREFLSKCYGHNEVSSLKNLNDEDVLSLAYNLRKGMPVCTPIFDGVKEQDINNLLTLTDQSTSGQVTLIDGRTGDKFERPVTVGYIYMLKLHHLVDDKMHARSIGPYSLITQQPLGGKAQFGGQRFGEMEVWALEAYGASYILQEMLTVKSDDQIGRSHVYEAIIKGEETFETGIPESFNVLVKELRSIGLNLEMKKNKN
jgi:DNA-directed RNA polymerase subunit beta